MKSDLEAASPASPAKPLTSEPQGLENRRASKGPKHGQGSSRKALHIVAGRVSNVTLGFGSFVEKKSDIAATSPASPAKPLMNEPQKGPPQKETNASRFEPNCVPNGSTGV